MKAALRRGWKKGATRRTTKPEPRRGLIVGGLQNTVISIGTGGLPAAAENVGKEVEVITL